MGNIFTNPVVCYVCIGILVLSILGFVIYYFATGKKYRYDDYNSDDNTNEDLSLRSNNYAKVLNIS